MFKSFGLSRRAASLADQWRAVVGMAISMARHILRLEAARPREALTKAEMLKACLLCALTDVTKQIETEDRETHLPLGFRRQKRWSIYRLESV